MLVNAWTHLDNFWIDEFVLTLMLLFLQEEIQQNHDLIGRYRHHIVNDMNQFNLQLFVKSYNR